MVSGAGWGRGVGAVRLSEGVMSHHNPLLLLPLPWLPSLRKALRPLSPALELLAPLVGLPAGHPPRALRAPARVAGALGGDVLTEHDHAVLHSIGSGYAARGLALFEGQSSFEALKTHGFFDQQKKTVFFGKVLGRPQNELDLFCFSFSPVRQTSKLLFP